MKAAVFDSGVGGLTVARSLIKHNLFSEIIYYGDTARVPYGTKDQNTIVRYSLEALEFFNNFEPDLMIVACNTASAYALDELKAKAKFPVVGVIEPGVLALKNSGAAKDSRILVIGTQATIGSGIYQNLLASRGFSRVSAIATPLLVPLVEEGILEGEIVEAAFRRYFGERAACEYDAAIMGCTHYPLMQNALAAWFDGAKLVHSGEAIVEYLKANRLVCDAGASIDAALAPKIQFFASENAEKLRKVAEEWLK